MNKKLLRDIQKIADRNRDANICKAAKDDTRLIYSAICMALWRLLDIQDEDEKFEAINQIIAESQKLYLTMSMLKRILLTPVLN